MYRVALGYDLHRLKSCSQGAVICGGVRIPCEYELDGAHSDGDTIFHALTDALLSLVGEDIGGIFSNTDPVNKNRKSSDFLLYAFDCIKEFYYIVNIDIIVICDQPKISPWVSSIKKIIASYLNIEENRISIRGKTTEGTRPLTIETYTNVLFQKINESSKSI